MRRSDSFARITLTLIFMYLFTLGATWNGVLIPALKFMSLGLTGLLAVMYFIIRSRGGWRWYRSPFDLVFPLWGLAFAISILANMDSLRRSMMGLWYVGLYVGVWYALYDALTNKAITRRILIEAFLFAGLIIVIFGYVQLSLLDLSSPQSQSRRLVSLIGNPNTLGTFLLVLFTLIVGQFLQVKVTIGRIVLGMYALATLIILILTFSRGAFLGLLSAMLVLGLFYLDIAGLTTLSNLRIWWHGRTAATRYLTIGLIAAVSTFIAIIAAVSINQTLTDSARNLGLRGEIWRAALLAFSDKPLTGHGLFTFGQELARFQSQPPELPHSHAHNAVLHIAAESGIPGLIALGVSVVVLAVVIGRNYQAATGNERVTLAAFASVIVGYSVAHLFDVLAMMPLLALIGVLLLAAVMLPSEPRQITAKWRLRGHPVGMGLLWTSLLITGGGSATIQADYDGILRDAVLTGNYRAGADALDAITKGVEGNMPIYVNQQAYLYGVAAYEGDSAALQRSMSLYERYLELEPQDSIAMTNLAALYAQDGQYGIATDWMLRAEGADELAWQYFFLTGVYAEAAGDFYTSAQAFKRLTGNTYNLMYPQFGETEFRRNFAAQFRKPYTVTAPVFAVLYEDIQSEEQIELYWERSRFDVDSNRARTYKTVLRMLLYLHSAMAADYEDQFDDWLAEADRLVQTREDEAWIHIAQAEIARYYGDDMTYIQEREKARDLIEHQFDRPDFNTGLNVAHFQFLRPAIPRQFLPQVLYPSVEELPLLRMLSEP